MGCCGKVERTWRWFSKGDLDCQGDVSSGSRELAARGGETNGVAKKAMGGINGSFSEVEEKVCWVTLAQVSSHENVCWRGDGLGLVMSCNCEGRVCLECLRSEDIWTVNDFRGVSWQSFGQN